MLRAYVLNQFDIRAVQDEFAKNVIRSSHVEFLYVTFLESLYDDLEHSFNTVKPTRFLKSLPDAYSKKGRKLFYANGCNIHSHFLSVDGRHKPCPYLPIGSTRSDKNVFGETYQNVELRFEKMKQRILRECSDRVDSIEVVYQCEWEKKLKTPGSDEFNFFNSKGNDDLSPKAKPPSPMAPRDALCGGAVEVFQLIGRSADDYDVNYD